MNAPPHAEMIEFTKMMAKNTPKHMTPNQPPELHHFERRIDMTMPNNLEFLAQVMHPPIRFGKIYLICGNESEFKTIQTVIDKLLGKPGNQPVYQDYTLEHILKLPNITKSIYVNVDNTPRSCNPTLLKQLKSLSNILSAHTRFLPAFWIKTESGTFKSKPHPADFNFLMNSTVILIPNDHIPMLNLDNNDTFQFVILEPVIQACKYLLHNPLTWDATK